jgi:hypothetical protein
MTNETMANLLAPKALSALMDARRTVLPKRLVEPGPDAAQWQALLAAAATAPDHDQLLPWRLVLIDSSQREALGELFARALHERDAHATQAQSAQAREKAHRAPLLLMLVVDADKGDCSIDVSERLISAGCALQNMLLLALTSGKALKSQVLRQAFGLRTGEQAVCFLSLGTMAHAKPGKPRPDRAALCSAWTPVAT